MGPYHLSRRALGKLTAAAGVVAAAPLLRAQSKLEKTYVSISVAGRGSLHYLPLTIAAQLGYFKAEGIELDVREFGNEALAVQAVLAGTTDVCAGGFENTIDLQSKGHAFRSFVLMGRTPQIAVGVSTKTLPNYARVVDVKGAKIGISAPGSPTHMVARLVPARAGLRPSDVSFVEVGVSGRALAALRSGQIDVISHNDPVMTMLEQRGEVKIICDTRTLKGTQEVFGGNMPAACLYASHAFVQKNPNTSQALANAIVHGLKWLQTAGPGDIIRTVPESYLLGDRALYLAAFDKMRESISPDGVMPEDGPKTASRALADFDPSVKAERIVLSQVYTNDLALRAKDRYKA